MSRVINIISGKGGTGKTTIAVNLAAALSGFGKDVILIDADIDTPNVGILLGITDAEFTLTDYLRKKNTNLKKAIYQTNEGFKVLPSSLSYVSRRGDLARLKSAIRQCRKLAEYVIIDCPPGLGDTVKSVLKESDESIIITNPELPALSDNIKAINLAESHDNNILGVVVNKVTHAKFESKPSEVEGMLDYPIIGAIPSEKTVKTAMKASNSVIIHAPKSKFTKQTRLLASKLAGVDFNPERISLWQRVLGFFK